MSEDNTVMRVAAAKVDAETVAGAAYVKKVTHPPSEIPSEYKGIPDMSAANVVRMEFKSEENVPLTATISTAPNTYSIQTADKVLLLSMPGASVANYVFVSTEATRSQASDGMCQPAPSVGATIGQTGKSVTNQAGYNFGNAHQDFGTFRNTYKSNTYYLNATDFSNQGTVTTCKFKPNILNHTVDTFLNDVNEVAALDRALKPFGMRFCTKRRGAVHRDLDIVDLKDDKIKNPGTIYSIQTLNLGYCPGATQVPINAQFTLSNVIPTTASKVLTQSSKAATRAAKDGAFVVHQQAGPVADWVDYSTGPSVTTPRGLVASFLRYTDANDSAVYIPLYGANVSNTSPGPAYKALTGDTPWNNLDASWTLFEGLSASPTVEAISLPYITCKSFHGVELQPNPNSSLLPFQDLLPMPDPVALKIAAGIFHSRPDSLPASANDLGSISRVVIKHLPTAVSWLKDLFGNESLKEVAMQKAMKFLNVGGKKKAVVNGDKKMQKKIETVAKETKAVLKEVRSDKKQASTMPKFTNNKGGAYTPRPSANRSRSRSRVRINSKVKQA